VVIVAVAPKEQALSGVPEKAEYLLSAEWNVNIDADVDIWMIPPTKKPVFYGSRDVGCARLDSDNRGFMDDVVTLADGSKVKVDSDKETISLRCIEPGRYDLGVNLYAYRQDGRLLTGGLAGQGLPVTTTVESLPDRAQLVAFVPYDEAQLVDHWLRCADGPPRSYETRLDQRMKKTLREAQEEMDQGRPAMLAKRKQTTASGNGLPDDQAVYVLHDSVRSALPPKE
jgi:hypothetical protein